MGRRERRERVEWKNAQIECRRRIRRPRDVARRSAEVDEPPVREDEPAARRAQIVLRGAPEDGNAAQDPLARLQRVRAQLAFRLRARIARLAAPDVQHQLHEHDEQRESERGECVPHRRRNPVTRATEQRCARTRALLLDVDG